MLVASERHWAHVPGPLMQEFVGSDELVDVEFSIFKLGRDSDFIASRAISAQMHGVPSWQNPQGSGFGAAVGREVEEVAVVRSGGFLDEKRVVKSISLLWASWVASLWKRLLSSSFGGECGRLLGASGLPTAMLLMSNACSMHSQRDPWLQLPHPSGTFSYGLMA